MAQGVEEVVNWLAAIEQDPDWLEVENRPWANENCRWTHSHCEGYDYVNYDPRVHMRFFWNEQTQKLAGSIYWDNRTEGPPKGAHGASIMLVFDEILAYPVWRSGVAAFTANVNINLRKMIPFNTAAVFESYVTKAEGRKRFLQGVITSADGLTKYADATGLWIVSQGIGGSLAVHKETVAADRERQEHNLRVLTHPLNISAATNSTSLQHAPVLPMPDNDSTLPFQTQNLSNLATQHFSTPAAPQPLPPSYYEQHYDSVIQHSVAQQHNRPSPLISTFFESKL